MAIDTEQKRASSFIDACGIKIPPSGAISGVADREWLVGDYSGIGSAVLVPSFPASALISHSGVSEVSLSQSGVRQVTLTRRTS